MQSSTQVHREALQRQTQQDWANREYIELISGSIKRISDFLNSFDMSCRWGNQCHSDPQGCQFLIQSFLRSRLSTLNEKLTTLERQVDFLEAKVSSGASTLWISWPVWFCKLDPLAYFTLWLALFLMAFRSIPHREVFRNSSSCIDCLHFVGCHIFTCHSWRFRFWWPPSYKKQ